MRATDEPATARRVALVGPGRFWQQIVFHRFPHHYSVTTCPGPEFIADCPVLAGARCPLLENVEVIVTELDSSKVVNRRLAAAVRILHSGKPVIASGQRQLAKEQRTDR